MDWEEKDGSVTQSHTPVPAPHSIVNKEEEPEEFHESQENHKDSRPAYIAKPIKDSDDAPIAPSPASLHRSERDQQPPKRYESSLMVLSCVAGLIAKATPKQEEEKDSKEEPATYKEAVTAPDAAQLKAAMDAEVKALNENEMWDLVDLPLNWRALQGRWVYRYKRDSNGSIIKHKARWVVKGFKQRYGVDYNKTYVSVITSTTYKVAFAIAAYYDYHLEQMNVKTAFLNGILEEKVFVTQLTGYTNGTEVCRLNKALYELEQSPQIWYQIIHKFL